MRHEKGSVVLRFGVGGVNEGTDSVQQNSPNGDQLVIKTEEQLFAEMRTLAVLAQNLLDNIVRVRSSARNRDDFMI